ncbi:hypothetical protein R1sor_001474 [Riccia sorocarpa]|uniref:Uncharacterized protein n=1 Tax=Riccia sorocarpa TaxID=122646 RepID=A0ABD3GZ68_9MARC
MLPKDAILMARNVGLVVSDDMHFSHFPDWMEANGGMVSVTEMTLKGQIGLMADRQSKHMEAAMPTAVCGSSAAHASIHSHGGTIEDNHPATELHERDKLQCKLQGKPMQIADAEKMYLRSSEGRCGRIRPRLV